jgi:YD repeat-containing protein
MNKKYERYIEYIVNDIEPPYFINMREMYGLKQDEYELVLSKVYDQPVTIKGNWVYDSNGNQLYSENSGGYWNSYEYDSQGNLIYYENSNGFWEKREYDDQRNLIYIENSDGYWSKYEYDIFGNKIYYENNRGVIIDKR